jgi:hypothetical protein
LFLGTEEELEVTDLFLEEGEEEGGEGGGRRKEGGGRRRRKEEGGRRREERGERWTWTFFNFSSFAS